MTLGDALGLTPKASKARNLSEAKAMESAVAASAKHSGNRRKTDQKTRNETAKEGNKAKKQPKKVKPAEAEESKQSKDQRTIR